MKEEYTLAELEKFNEEYMSSLFNLLKSNLNDEKINWTLDRAFSEFKRAIQKLLDGEFEISKGYEKVEE